MTQKSRYSVISKESNRAQKNGERLLVEPLPSVLLGVRGARWIILPQSCVLHSYRCS